MRRAAFVLLLCCVSAGIKPVALRAAADTGSRAEVSVVNPKTEAVVVLPRAAAKNPSPGSATLSTIQQNDPHPLMTEFFGPAPKAKKPTPVAPVKTNPHAKLDLAPAE
ncbi:MAG TPA: hypothetical protein VMZ25_09520 [Terriglobales bacterium]|nr:hypothetical protein [Terriglobales bacterium]